MLRYFIFIDISSFSSFFVMVLAKIKMECQYTNQTTNSIKSRISIFTNKPLTLFSNLEYLMLFI